MLQWLRGDPYPFASRVLLHTKAPDERSFRGVLWEERRGFVVLKQAELLKSDGSVSVLQPGEVLIDRRDVSFVQMIGTDPR